MSLNSSSQGYISLYILPMGDTSGLKCSDRNAASPAAAAAAAADDDDDDGDVQIFIPL